MEKIFVTGIGMTSFGRHLDRSVEHMVGEALDLALGDAGAQKSDIEAAYHSSTTQGFLQGQNSISGQIVLGKLGIQGIPIFNVENACASGTSSFHLAAQSVGAGVYDIALAVGVEKMNIADKVRMFQVFDSGWDVTEVDANAARLIALGEGVEEPEGAESKRPYSLFMKVYAAFGRNHIKRYGTTQEQIAAISAKNHQHSEFNELSQFRQPFTIEEILAAPPITFPLTMPMCAPISDGAAAVVICNEEGRKRIGGDASRAVELLSSVVGSGNANRSAEDPDRHCAYLAAGKAYEKAGLGPDDMDVCEVHDATAVGELMHAENLRFVPIGEAGPAALRGDFTIGGRIPINTSGGLESKGHPIAATGLGQIHELVTQLRGEAGKRQVEGACHAIQENSGGLVGIEEASVVVNIFSRNLI